MRNGNRTQIEFYLILYEGGTQTIGYLTYVDGNIVISGVEPDAEENAARISRIWDYVLRRSEGDVQDAVRTLARGDIPLTFTGCQEVSSE